MIEPKHPTEAEILGRIRYHEAGAIFYAQHLETATLERWSKERVEYWRQKLPSQPERSIAPTLLSQPTASIVQIKKDRALRAKDTKGGESGREPGEDE